MFKYVPRLCVFGRLYDGGRGLKLGTLFSFGIFGLKVSEAARME